MDYLSAEQIAQSWHVSARSVRNYCAQGRVPGAQLVGGSWSIPADAQKPARAGAGRARLVAESPLLQTLRNERADRRKGGIYHKVQVELTYNSNRIEGSRLSLDQTRLIFETATVGGDAIRIDDVVETVNHFRCIDYCIDHACEPVDEGMIKTLHGMLKTSTADAGKDWFAVGDYKKLPNEVGGRATAAPERVAAEVRGLLRDYRPEQAHDFQQIVEFHVRFERIHPFQDGNGRVGRLIMLKECLANGIVPFVISDDMKFFYYRGLSEWDNERGFLLDTCLAAQDRFKEWLDYFRIA